MYRYKVRQWLFWSRCLCLSSYSIDWSRQNIRISWGLSLRINSVVTPLWLIDRNPMSLPPPPPPAVHAIVSLHQRWVSFRFFWHSVAGGIIQVVFIILLEINHGKFAVLVALFWFLYKGVTWAVLNPSGGRLKICLESSWTFRHAFIAAKHFHSIIS